MILLSILGAAVAAWFLLPALSDLVALARPRAAARPAPLPRPASRLLFLIPSHDEELLITDCVQSVLALQYPRESFRAVVVADNCTDRTAELARAAGAECLERHDLSQRGKPYAVAWAFERLDMTAYDGVVILDADAVVDPQFAAALDARGPINEKAIECYDDVRNRRDNALTRMGAVLSAARIRGSYYVKQRAGLNIPLGDGMCIGSGVLQAHPWRAFGLSEDWEVYALLTAAGVPIELASDAHLYAQEATSLKQSSAQRQRWFAGRIAALWRVGPALLRSRRIGWHQKLDAIVELAAPGPAAQLGVSAGLAALVWATGAPAADIVGGALLISLARPAMYAVVGLRHDPEPVRSLLSFAYLPFYAVWRIGNAAGSIRHLWDREWVRTAR